jgi:hypothetical protein
VTFNEAAFTAERDRLALLTRKGIGMPVAGLIYWLAVAVILRRMPESGGLVVCFIATGAVFPLGALLTKLAGGDLFAKSATFTPLGLQLAAVQLFYWPIIILVFREVPEWTPFTMAVLMSSHFLPYWWLYGSRGYALLAALTMVTTTTAVIVAGDPLFEDVPLIVAGCYALSCAVLGGEVAALRRLRSGCRLRAARFGGQGSRTLRTGAGPAVAFALRASAPKEA